MKFESEEELMAWVAKSSHLWLFLDCDGPLTELACPPDHLQPDPQFINLLFELSDNPNTRATIVSGRSLEHIRNLFPVSGIYLAGVYGIELFTPNGDVIQRLSYEEVRSFLEWIKSRWALIISGQDGYDLEDEGWSIVLHAPSDLDPAAEGVINQARKTLHDVPIPGDFRILSGRNFLKITPLLGSKTEIVNYLLNRYPYSNSCILYVGYNGNEQDNPTVAHADQALAVKVIQPSRSITLTDPEFLFRSPLEALHWMEKLI